MPANHTPIKVDNLRLAFPTGVADLMPDYQSIPEEFKRWPARTWGGKLFSQLFYSGGSVAHLVAKPGIDRNDAIRHIRVIMGSFEPKHEHKEAACAYLFHEWFEEPKP